MKKIQELNEIIKNNANDNNKIEKLILDLFKEQLHLSSLYEYIILTEEQYSLLDDDFDFSIFGETLVCVEYEGEIDFVHCFHIKDLESIKKRGLLTSYSKSRYNYIPNFGYGIYAVESTSINEISYEFIDFLSFKYHKEDELGYVEGTYKGKYLKCIYDYSHKDYILLKEDVTLDMIKNIDTKYLYKLIQEVYNL